jgi:hypothetical protein
MRGSPYFRKGRGTVPATPLVAAAWKELCELPATATAGAIAEGLGSQLDFTSAGLTIDQFRGFFDEALAAAKKVEPIVEAGNKYSVDKHFSQLNGELLLHEIKHSSFFEALSSTDKVRAEEFFNIMCLTGELRNRNPLHPNPLDSVVISNLLNFPKHIFGFPFGCYSTNGNESLSVVLFSYRAQCKQSKALVVYVSDCDTVPGPDFEACAARLSMPFMVVTNNNLSSFDVTQAAVVMCDFTNPALGKVAAWAGQAGVGLHIHLLDGQLRGILDNPEPVHFDLPKEVRSLSIENGLFRSGYQLYRDPELRDLHFDLPLEWQSQYLSPNEGGSGNTTPLYIDFCFILLGWSALRDAAAYTVPTEANLEASGRLAPQELGPRQAEDGALEQDIPRTFEGVHNWATSSMDLPREQLERNVFRFQQHFTGGKGRDVEAITSGGGTRSINYAFESVLARAKAGGVSPIKLVTGNPHLAVERAQRRFLFDVIRVHTDGIICLEGLKREIADPCVVMAYLQTLSITDGITDPLPAAIAIIEEENVRRQAAGQVPVTLINDSCLAFSVLLHNDGDRYGPESMRVLDLTKGLITPTIMTQDAHKHLGADKGISMAMGTPGTLSRLTGLVKVGAQPTRGELTRAMADMLLVGMEGYHEKYNRLSAAVDDATEKIAAAGMTIVHSHNRVRGSTAFSVEDPSAEVSRKLKKKGHGPSPVFRLHPEDPSRCQTAFLMSLTPHCLREITEGVPALDIFVADVVACHKEAKANPSTLASFFSEDSLPAILLRGGNEENWGFANLHDPGAKREFLSVVFRRLYSAIMDSGVVCTNRQPAPLKTILGRTVGAAALMVGGVGYAARSKL